MKNIPEFLYKLLEKEYGNELKNKIIEGYSNKRFVTLRVNTIKSNKEEIHLEVCDKCHPFYVGGKDSGLVSKTGRVEKFNRKYGMNKEAK